MNTERGWFGFFIVLALTLNFGFVMGDIDNPAHHHTWELMAAFVVSLIATILKLGDRSPLGSVFLATSVVADFQLFIGVGIWTWFSVNHSGEPMNASTMASIVSMAGGAMVANICSVVLLLYETISIRR